MTSIVIVVLGSGLVLSGLNNHLHANARHPGEPTPSPSPSPSAPLTPQAITILGAGDVIVHPPVWEQARADKGGNGYDFFPIFEDISGTVSEADLALCHLETPIASPGAAPNGFPRFNTPPELLDGLKKAGFDGCSTASNHALDRGVDGVKRTLDAMDKAGLGHAGSARTAEEAGSVKLYEVQGVKVAHLSYTYGFSGVKPPAGKEWVTNVINVGAIRAAARKARESEADIVVLSMHWGTEYQHLPNADQEKWAREVLAGPDVDLVLGHHSHSVQAMEQIGEKWVAYGLGNQVARPSAMVDKDREGVMVRVTLGESGPRWRVTKVEAIATWTELTPKVRIIELPKAVSDQSLPAATRQRYRATLSRIAGYLRLRGATASGLLVVGSSGTPGSAG